MPSSGRAIFAEVEASRAFLNAQQLYVFLLLSFEDLANKAGIQIKTSGVLSVARFLPDRRPWIVTSEVTGVTNRSSAKTVGKHLPIAAS